MKMSGLLFFLGTFLSQSFGVFIAFTFFIDKNLQGNIKNIKSPAFDQINKMNQIEKLTTDTKRPSGLEQSANGTSGSNFDARGLSKGPENLFVYS